MDLSMAVFADQNTLGYLCFKLFPRRPQSPCLRDRELLVLRVRVVE
jgi:hypothetical protein